MAKDVTVKEPTEVRGLVLLSFALILFLSLLSFVYGHETQNLLGIVGTTIGWISHLLFGFMAFALSPFLAWAGWRMLFRKPINRPKLKIFHIALLLISSCILLNLIEDQAPRLLKAIHSTTYCKAVLKKMEFHLGGSPLFYLYKDLPDYNFLRIFNILGISIIFTSTLLTSIFYLAKISPSKIFEQVRALIAKIQEAFEKRKMEKTKQDKSFWRLVSVRTPDAPHKKTLAIQPERDLKERPSLSRKTITIAEEKKPVRQRALDAQRV